jgi:hypothetical protein
VIKILGDETLTKTKRAVGVVLIMRCGSYNNFKSSYRDTINWPKIALLSGYGEAAAKKAYADLVAVKWFEEDFREDGNFRYGICGHRISRAIDRQVAHNVLLKERKAEDRLAQRIEREVPDLKATGSIPVAISKRPILKLKPSHAT